MISVQLKPEIEERLKTVAGESGQTPEEYVAVMVESEIAAKPLALAQSEKYYLLPPDEQVKKFQQWLAKLPKREGPPLSDWAVSRDSMYD